MKKNINKKINHCSLSPDKIFNIDVSSCCKVHDKDYENKNPKIKSDIKLFKCISEKTNMLIGLTYFTGVSLFGFISYYF